MPSISSSATQRARDDPGRRQQPHRLVEARGRPAAASRRPRSSAGDRRAPSSTSASIRSRASGFSASRYHIHESALAVVSWPASMNVATSSRTRFSGSGLPSSSRTESSRPSRSSSRPPGCLAVVDHAPDGVVDRLHDPCRRSERRRQDGDVAHGAARRRGRAAAAGWRPSSAGSPRSAARRPPVTVGPIRCARSADPVAEQRRADDVERQLGHRVRSSRPRTRRRLAPRAARRTPRSAPHQLEQARRGGAWPAPG